jgi:hypothetical protein
VSHAILATQEDLSSKLAQANSSETLSQKNIHHKKGLVQWPRVQTPVLKKKKKRVGKVQLSADDSDLNVFPESTTDTRT